MLKNVFRSRYRQSDRGDTLIEVLFAFAALSLVIVGALAIMNQGTTISERSLETTLVREQIDDQATTLRFLHDAYVAAYTSGGTYAQTTPAGQWNVMANRLSATAASPFTVTNRCPSPPSGSFVLNSAKATYVANAPSLFKNPDTYAQVTYNAANDVTDSRGIWIEGIRSAASADVNKQNTRYIDFHIRACWYGPGQDQPMTIGTIVRLYEPRG